MAQDDITRLTIHYEGPTQAASTSIYYQENGLSTDPVGPIRSLLKSFDTALQASLRGVLSAEWKIASFHATIVNNRLHVPESLTPSTVVGSIAGPSLPGNNCILMQLLQPVFPKRSNGRMYFPGVGEGISTIGQLTQAFISGPLTTLAAELVSQIDEDSGSGDWVPGLISQKVLNAAPPAKDWDGAFAPLDGTRGWPVIARQRRRTTKVRGYTL